MADIPDIAVQLVHIQGPLKGEIQTFADTQILIGRHPDCHVQFPKDLVTLSRIHAKIVRDGNRFKLIDQSTNGTFVNGRNVAEAYLKDGDVIMFAEGGPKVSFLTQAADAQDAPSATAAPHPAKPQAVQPPAPQSPPQPAAPPTPAPEPAPAGHQPQPPSPPAPSSPQPSREASPPRPATQDRPDADVAIETVKVPLAIQFGPALKSFQTVPVTVGKGAGCDFVINHPALQDRHAQFFFAGDSYWVKDLTGSYAVTINGSAIQRQAPLQQDAIISLSDTGPKFRFLGGGRLAEVEQAPPQPPSPEPPPSTDRTDGQGKDEAENKGQKAGSLFKKFFR